MSDDDLDLGLDFSRKVSDALKHWSLDDQTRDDLCQEVWIRLWTRRREARYRNPSPGFIGAIARHLLIDEHRHWGRRRRGEVPESRFDDHEQHSSSHSERLNAVIALIQQLPRSSREVLELQLAGNGVAEIAAKLSLRPGTVRVRAHKGTRRLRRLVTETHERHSPCRPTR